MNEFREIQRFRQWWIWAVALVLLIAPIVVVISMIIPQKMQDHEVFIVLFTILLGLLPAVLLFTMRLETGIDTEGVHYRFFPVHRRRRTIPWNQIKEITVRNYSPIGEYGGWGIRIAPGNGIALNTSGRDGIQLVLTNGKRILLGTQHAEEAARIIGIYRQE